MRRSRPPHAPPRGHFGRRPPAERCSPPAAATTTDDCGPGPTLPVRPARARGRPPGKPIPAPAAPRRAHRASAHAPPRVRAPPSCACHLAALSTLQRGGHCSVRLVCYAKLPAPTVAAIEAHPPAGPDTSNCVLTFNFGDAATAPPPKSLAKPAAPVGAASTQMSVSDASGDGTSAGVGHAGAAHQVGTHGSEHPYVATECAPPFRIVSCNSSFVNLTGVPEAELRGRTIDLLYAHRLLLSHRSHTRPPLASSHTHYPLSASYRLHARALGRRLPATSDRRHLNARAVCRFFRNSSPVQPFSLQTMLFVLTLRTAPPRAPSPSAASAPTPTPPPSRRSAGLVLASTNLPYVSSASTTRAFSRLLTPSHAFSRLLTPSHRSVSSATTTRAPPSSSPSTWHPSSTR